jgi:putative transposase
MPCSRKRSATFHRSPTPVTGLLQITPEGLYGRRKRVARLRRQDGLPSASRGAADRAMRTFGLEGVQRVKKFRTRISNAAGNQAGNLLNRELTTTAPNRV